MKVCVSVCLFFTSIGPQAYAVKYVLLRTWFAGQGKIGGTSTSSIESININKNIRQQRHKKEKERSLVGLQSFRGEMHYLPSRSVY